MAKESQNVHIYDDSNYGVFVGANGDSAPTTFSLDGNGNIVPPSGMVEVGLLSDAGISEGHNLNETKIHDMAGQLLRIARNQEERPFTFVALEDNPMVRRLLYRSTTTTTGATAEVQTLTVSGSPTGGTFDVTLGSFGTASGIAYNASASTVQTALQAAWGLDVTVSGTLSAGATITYPTASGNVPLAVADGSNLTGGTTPSADIVVTTPGVTGINSTPVGSGTGRDLRPYFIPLKDGDVVKVFSINVGEAVQSGNTDYTGSGAAEYQFTLQPYKDGNGRFYTVLDNDPAQGESSD